MNSTFDLRIKQSTWKQTMEVYAEAKKQLEQERDNHFDNVAYMAKGWES